MRNFQGINFVWIRTNREIFKSALVHLYQRVIGRDRISCPKVFCEKVFLKILQYSKENTCAGNFIKKSLRNRCFLVNFANLFKNAYFKEHLRLKREKEKEKKEFPHRLKLASSAAFCRLRWLTILTTLTLKLIDWKYPPHSSKI